MVCPEISRSPCGERGLKYHSVANRADCQRRSPCGERGLKSLIVPQNAAKCHRRSPCGERGLKCRHLALVRRQPLSLPVRGAWIEIAKSRKWSAPKLSLPVRGAWIEITPGQSTRKRTCWSLPVRGAWIEMFYGRTQSEALASLPVRGAWIEIQASSVAAAAVLRRSPCGERGLKLLAAGALCWRLAVAPRAGSVD